MADTQWPRFIVFHQEKPDRPHVYAGSVHAPDPEMALMNARDVFVRRPACVSLWTVPASAIFSSTAEELAQQAHWPTSADLPDETFLIIQKSAHKGTYIHIGESSAPTPLSALIKSFGAIADRSALAWWVFPQRSVTQSTPEDIEILFQPAEAKDYRDQAFFHTVAALQKIKTQEVKTDEA
jgi:ring-1,2-phenylacetyl-CoA epoxidase subunit PaaB